MRKQPQQERSKVLVNIILQATEKAVCLHGLQGVTTPKVAELAGVSVGSIYQYFEDKQQMLEWLLEQKSQDLGQQLKQLLSREAQQDLGVLVRLSINFGFAALTGNRFYLEVIKHWHNLPQSRATEVMQQHFFELGQQLLLKHHQGLCLNNLASKLFIIINSTMYSMMRYLGSQPSVLAQDEIVEELTHMIMAYLHYKPLEKLV